MRSKSFGRVCAQELYPSPKAIRAHREQFVSVCKVFLVDPIANAALRHIMEAIPACCANSIRLLAASFTLRLQWDISVDGIAMAPVTSREATNQGLANVQRAVAGDMENFPTELQFSVTRPTRRTIRSCKKNSVPDKGFG